VSSEKRHPIQVVARRTGLTADVLRAWEKRYRAVTPERSTGRRRLYSDDDIERLRLLRLATLGGRSIGQVAGFPTDQLAALVREDETAAAAAPPVTRAAPAADARAMLDRCLTAVEGLDAAALDGALSLAVTALAMDEFLDAVVAPLLEQVGRRWETGRLTVAHEHAASAVVRRVLGGILSTWADREGAPTLVVGTPSGERHEFGAMMVAATAAAVGWRVVYVGPDVPVDSLVAAVRAREARVVALSVVAPASVASVMDDLSGLREALPDDVTVLVGGRALGPGTLEGAAGATHLTSLGEVREFLVRVGRGGGVGSG
jgi:methanogenic corrinoid protein MtbC1